MQSSPKAKQSSLIAIALIGLVALTAGCSRVRVVAQSGEVFTAPSLCEALVRCAKSQLSPCMYDSSMIADGDKAVPVRACIPGAAHADPRSQAAEKPMQIQPHKIPDSLFGPRMPTKAPIAPPILPKPAEPQK